MSRINSFIFEGNIFNYQPKSKPLKLDAARVATYLLGEIFPLNFYSEEML